MTKLFFRLSTFVLLLSTIFMTSCEEGVELPGGGTNAVVPTVRLVSGADLISADADLAADASFKVQVSASQGDAPLKSLTIFENGTRVPASRLEVNGNPAAANPLLIVTEADKASFTYDITITGLPAGVNNYEFEVGDDDNEAGSVSVNVTGTSEPLAINLQQSNTFDGVEPGSLVTIPVTIKGGAALSTIEVAANGALVDASNLAFKEASNTFASNPLTLDAADQGGFEGNLYIRAVSGNNTYTITITDATGTTASTDVTINAGTALDGEFMAILVSNADGPDEGGLDLYNGTSVPRASDAAQVVDLGINTDLGAATNWLQEVAPENGATLRKPSGDQPEGFKYENIDTEEAIIAAYDSAGGNLETSGKLSVGDILLVEDSGNYFMLQIMTVNATSNDNKDFYEINVKQAIR